MVNRIWSYFFTDFVQTIVVGSGAGQDIVIASSAPSGLPLNVGPTTAEAKRKKSKKGKLNFALELDLPHHLKWPQCAETAALTPKREEPKAKKERPKRRKADEIEGDSYSKFSSHKFVSGAKGLKKMEKIGSFKIQKKVQLKTRRIQVILWKQRVPKIKKTNAQHLSSHWGHFL